MAQDARFADGDPRPLALRAEDEADLKILSALVQLGFVASIHPGPARMHYRRRRDHGDRHAAALRHLFNKMLGQLHHCLQTREIFDAQKAFGYPGDTQNSAAA